MLSSQWYIQSFPLLFYSKLFGKLFRHWRSALVLWQAANLDRVQRRWTSIALSSQACSLCLRPAESIRLLLLHCSLVGRLWNRFSSLIRGFLGHTPFPPSFFVNGLPAAPDMKKKKLWVGALKCCWTVSIEGITGCLMSRRKGTVFMGSSY